MYIGFLKSCLIFCSVFLCRDVKLSGSDGVVGRSHPLLNFRERVKPPPPPDFEKKKLIAHMRAF